MREIRMLRTMWRELETELGDGLRHRRVAKAAGKRLLPVPKITAPALDPTWSSGRQSDLPTDCTGTRPTNSPMRSIAFCPSGKIWRRAARHESCRPRASASPLPQQL